MNQREAFKATLELAWERGMHFQGQTLQASTTYQHLVRMHDEVTVHPERFSPTKLGRWLGWAQAAVVASGVATLDDMKKINRLYSEDDEATLDGATQEPERGVQLATAGEFAARWNTWTPEHRQQAFENMQDSMRMRNRCVQEDHEGLKEQLDRAHARIYELLTRPPLQYAVLTDADLGRAAQTFYEEVSNTDGVELLINMTDKAILVGILEKTLAALGFRRPLKRENYDVVYQHEDCEHCEAAVELAIAEIKERGTDHASWTVVSAPPDSQAPAEEHVGKASLN